MPETIRLYFLGESHVCTVKNLGYVRNVPCYYIATCSVKDTENEYEYDVYEDERNHDLYAVKYVYERRCCLA